MFYLGNDFIMEINCHPTYFYIDGGRHCTTIHRLGQVSISNYCGTGVTIFATFLDRHTRGVVDLPTLAFGDFSSRTFWCFLCRQRLQTRFVKRYITTHFMVHGRFITRNKHVRVGDGNGHLYLQRFFGPRRGVRGTMGNVYMCSTFNNRRFGSMGYPIRSAITIRGGGFRRGSSLFQMTLLGRSLVQVWTFTFSRVVVPRVYTCVGDNGQVCHLPLLFWSLFVGCCLFMDPSVPSLSGVRRTSVVVSVPTLVTSKHEFSKISDLI